jgi:anti-sigma factor RsiW
MHCGRVSNLLSAYIDRELAGTEMLQIRRHLDDCPGCSAAYGSLRRVKSLLSAAPPAEPFGDPTAAVMRRWHHRHEQASVSAPRWNWSWHWKGFSAPRRWQRYSLAFTSLCLVMAVGGTALALRKPNYPDALAANVLPALQRPDERLPVLEPPVAVEVWPSEVGWRRVAPPAAARDPWWSSPGGTSPELVSYTSSPAFWMGR